MSSEVQETNGGREMESQFALSQQATEALSSVSRKEFRNGRIFIVYFVCLKTEKTKRRTVEVGFVQSN